jgi:breast cancer 2 susceptibility protein
MLFSASPDTESVKRSNSPRPKICIDSLKDALRFGDMSCDPETCLQNGVTTVTLLVNSTNACQVLFDAQSGLPLGFVDSVRDQDTKVVGELSDIRKALTSHVGESLSLLKDRWILCQMRWIVWKLASYERSFSEFLAGQYFTYGNLISQLRRRFEYEIKAGHRPPLRKILNRDAASTSLMILCVSQLITEGPLAATEEDTAGSTGAQYKIELTDGWYSIQAVLDSKLCEFLRSGRVRVGTKLLISNAQLVGADDGVDPLDEDYDPASRQCQIGLRLSANATRLAKWNAKLGFVRPSTMSRRSSHGLLLVRRVSDILPGGGNIPCLQVTIVKRYPKLFYEKSGDSSGPGGSSSILSEAKEDARRMEFERRTMSAVEKISESIEEELEKVSPFSSLLSRLCHRC